MAALSHSTSALSAEARGGEEIGVSYSRSLQMVLTSQRCAQLKDGDEWVINGQSGASGAHYSDYGCVVVRTDPTVPSFAGSGLFLHRHEVTRHRDQTNWQLTGESDFNEVYFTDVRVPDSQRLGEVGRGWQVSLTTLMNERAAIGAGSSGVNVNGHPARRGDDRWQACD